MATWFNGVIYPDIELINPPAAVPFYRKLTVGSFERMLKRQFGTLKVGVA